MIIVLKLRSAEREIQQLLDAERHFGYEPKLLRRVQTPNDARLCRGGAFKPRTSPYDFEGLGREGLELLRQARAATGLPIVTEVMSPQDVEIVAETADVLQIGARNAQNVPLLAAAAASGKTILLKRGISSYIDEWLLAAEYICVHGNSKIILCERGIRTFEHACRNTLDVSAVAVAKKETHLPVFVDPSH